MREHGLLNRVLLIYEEAVRRLIGQRELPPEVLADSAGIVRTFIENYHEKNEENYLFPRFEKAGKLVDLVKVLRSQHQAGRRLTESIQQLSTLTAFKNAGDRSTLATTIHKFVRMYRPHEAREDTVLFPALRSIVSAHEFGALGEQFEDKEHELFGAEGFEKMVDKVAGLEKRLGIYDLAQFTPSDHSRQKLALSLPKGANPVPRQRISEERWSAFLAYFATHKVDRAPMAMGPRTPASNSGANFQARLKSPPCR
jgi:hemerythrin-like domain-containing protein